jgi:thioredoxin-like negative regulator of GroEL
MCFNPDTQVGNYQQALLDATRALELAPRWTKAWLRLASAYEGLGDFIRAEAVLTAARKQCDATSASLLDAAVEQLDAAKREMRQVCVFRAAGRTPGVVGFRVASGVP